MNESDANAAHDDEPKIVVDDDWKNRAEREKEELQQRAQEADEQGEIPEASFPMLVTTMATQTLMNLGQLPDPLGGQPVIRKPLAKHFIDMLAMLEEKTKGNLTEDEAAMLGDTLHQLRMLFVSIPDSTPDEPDAKGGPSIEIPT